MRVDDVVTRLVACGLQDKEARAFANLLRLGPSKVTDLAKAAGLKRAESYQVLDRLQSRGLVEVSLARPRKYVAIPPDRAIDVLVEERQQALRSIEGMREDLEARLGRLAGRGEAPTGEAFRVLHDHNQITGQLGRTLRRTERDLCVVASSRALFKLLLDEGLEDEFEAVRARGATIRILTDLLPGQEDVAGNLSRFGEVRHMLVPRPLRFFVGDDREIVQYVTADPLGGGAETALWLGARDHVQAQRAFFDDLWSGAMAVEARVAELQEGRAPGQVQVVKGRFTRYERVKEMLLRAKTEIAAVLTEDEVARLEPSGLLRVLRARLAQGVRVRILAPQGRDVALEGADVRALDEGASVPRIFVDGAEALLVLPGDDPPGSVTGLTEHAVWVTLAPSVEALRAAFERLWEKSGGA